MAVNVTDEFEHHRTHLRAVAYRMLGSVSEAEDAVQEAWLRLNRSDTSAVSNLGAWLTTVVGRVCLDMLRARRARRDGEVDGLHGLNSAGVRLGESFHLYRCHICLLGFVGAMTDPESRM